MKYWLVLSLFLFTSPVWAQETFSGKTVDAQKNSLSARINLRKQQEIIAYTSSDSKGQFSITIPEHSDTLILEIRKMGYSPLLISFYKTLSQKEFILEKTNIELEEVVIKSPPIRKFGDTLSYKVSEFSSNADQSIGDVISKLPGIEIKSNGQIFYEGKPINRYYINDINLLDGRYGLVNENLEHQKVQSIEILQNHQPIRALDSLNVSERAAINIKLKNKVTHSTTLNAGIGARPLLWEANITPMVFTPQLQFINSLQSNNSGKNLLYQVQDHIQELSLGASLQLLRTLSAASPPLSSYWWLNNISHLGSINALKKLNSFKDLKINAQLLLQQEKRLGGSDQRYFLQGETIQYVETRRNREADNQFKAELEYVNNAPKKYFINKLSLAQHWEDDSGLSQRPQLQYNQIRNNRDFTIQNHFQQLIRLKKQHRNLVSSLRFTQTDENLEVEKMPNERYLQSLAIKQFLSSHSFNFTLQLSPNWSVAVLPMLHFDHHELQSSLHHPEIITDTLNHFSWTHLRYTTQVGINYKRNSLSLRLNQGINYQWINYSIQSPFHRWNWNPSFNLYWQPSSEFNMGFSSVYNQTYSLFTELYPAYIMHNYLSIEQKNGDFRTSKTWSSTVNFALKNVIKAFNLNGNYRFSLSNENIITQTQINADGSSISTQVPYENQRYSHSVGSTLSKYFFSSKTNLSLSTLFAQNQVERYLNETLRPYQFSTFTPALTLQNYKSRYIDGTYTIEYTLSQNSNQKLSTTLQKLAIGLSPIKENRLEFKVEHYQISTQNRPITLMHLMYQLSISKQKIELSFMNITNQKNYQMIQLSDYYQSQSYFQLRPRQVMIRTRLSL